VYGGPVDHVSIDNAAAAQAAVTHLLELGRTRIAAIGEQRRRSSGTARLRLRGYTNALKAAGLPVDPDLVRSSESYHRADGAAEMEALLALPQPPDAVFCFNDLLALGALRTLLERGLRVPDDVAVVGFDDIDDGRYNVPSLTTISPDKAGIARSSLRLLLDRISAVDSPPREVTVSHELRVRESSGASTRRRNS
jgi:LacI family transcriptional regulator, repressor for deo operon, udp, cdd, tsx, nupC, and nupG